MQILFRHLTTLRQGQTKFGLAPHKPVLLLAVVEGFEKGYLNSPEITISEELLTNFYDIWKLLVTTRNIPDFSLPFFHLGTEKSGIWQLQPWPGVTIPVTKSNSIKSFKALRNTVQFARISDEFYRALMDPLQREEIKQILLERYFPDTAYRLMDKRIDRFSETVKKEILYEPDVNYARKVIRHFESITTEEREEEITLRNHIFRKAVWEKYDHRCAISGMKIETPNRVSMVDACHIIPFAQSHDDTISNGIALSPTFHRAFDHGLIAITNDYTIAVNKRITDHSLSNGLMEYHGKPIILPTERAFYPSIQKLEQQRERFS